MPELSEISTPLLIELLACTHNARQVVARLDAVLGHVAECTMHGSVLNQLQDATKEMVSTIEAYEEVCKSAIELMRHPNFPLAEFDAGGTRGLSRSTVRATTIRRFGIRVYAGPPTGRGNPGSASDPKSETRPPLQMCRAWNYLQTPDRSSPQRIGKSAA